MPSTDFNHIRIFRLAPKHLNVEVEHLPPIRTNLSELTSKSHYGFRMFWSALWSLII